MSIVQRKLLLYRIAEPTPPGPSVPFVPGPLILSSSDGYALDYQIQTGNEKGVVDFTWGLMTGITIGWRFLAGTSGSGAYWNMGTYRVANPAGNRYWGIQCGNSDTRVYATIPTNGDGGWHDAVESRRYLCTFYPGHFDAVETEGNWTPVQDGHTFEADGTVDVPTNLIGTPVYVCTTNIPYTFHGFRIYSSENGSLVADYEAGTVEGVPGIYNHITDTFFTQSAG